MVRSVSAYNFLLWGASDLAQSKRREIFFCGDAILRVRVSKEKSQQL